MKFKDMLKFFREREGLSQSELAAKLGLSTSTISMYEIGKREPDFETEEKIADFFNTDLNTLRGKDVEQKNSINVVTDEEYQLINNYRKLDDTHKKMILQTIEDYLYILEAKKGFKGQYTIFDFPGMPKS